MRRVVSPVLIGLGVFFLVVAVFARFYIPGQAIKFPLNEYTTNALVASNASYFSQKNVSEVSGVTLETVSTTRGDVAAAKATGNSGTVAIWQSVATTEDITNHTPVDIPAQPDTLAFNRTTGVLVPWSGNTVGGKHVAVSGQSSLFPLGTKKQNYQVFDTTLGKPVTFTYRGTSTTDGVPTYIFTNSVSSTQIGTVSLPGSIVGMSASEVTLPEFYSVSRTYQVDPETGVPLSVNETIRQTLQDSTGATRLVLISGDFKSAPASVSSGVSTDNSARTKILLLTVIIPIVGLVLGIVLIALGLVLGRRRPEDEEYEEAGEPVGSAA